MKSEFELLQKLEQVELPEEIKPSKRISLEGFWDKGKHVLILGKTGSGKTVLLQNLLIDFYNRGFKIIHRDDGGLEFLKTVDFIDKYTIYYPKQCYFDVSLENVELYQYDYEKVYDLVETLLETKNRFNIVLFDVFCKDKTLSAKFWSEFFDSFITILMQKHPTEKAKVLLSFDELNDLIQPEKYQLTDLHRKVRGIFEYNIRKLRKHGVKLICTAHRPNQLTLNVRSQFSFVFIKQSFGYDLYEFLNKELVHIGSKLFWRILRDIKDLPVEYAYIFDNSGHYDKFLVPNLREDLPYYEARGLIRKVDPYEQKQRELQNYETCFMMCENLARYGKIRLDIIATKLGISENTVKGRVYQQILAFEPVAEAFENAKLTILQKCRRRKNGKKNRR